MGTKRPSIPAGLKRQVYTEAGHRCAIPTCRGTSSLEIHHIKPWSEVKEHKFENLILLCAVCHGRCTKGEIQTKDMEVYKANLFLLNSRYSSLERRLLEFFGAQLMHGNELPIGLSAEYYISVKYLEGDGLVEINRDVQEIFLPREGVDVGVTRLGEEPLISIERIYIYLTDRGKDFVLAVQKGNTYLG